MCGRKVSFRKRLRSPNRERSALTSRMVKDNLAESSNNAAIHPVIAVAITKRRRAITVGDRHRRFDDRHKLHCHGCVSSSLPSVWGYLRPPAVNHFGAPSVSDDHKAPRDLADPRTQLIDLGNLVEMFRVDFDWPGSASISIFHLNNRFASTVVCFAR